MPWNVGFQLVVRRGKWPPGFHDCPFAKIHGRLGTRMIFAEVPELPWITGTGGSRETEPRARRTVRAEGDASGALAGSATGLTGRLGVGHGEQAVVVPGQ